MDTAGRNLRRLALSLSLSLSRMHVMSEAVEIPLSGSAIVRRLFSLPAHIKMISINEGQLGWKRKPAPPTSKCITGLGVLSSFG